MKNETEFGDAPAWPTQAKTKPLYGSVEGLDDEELADPCELERQVVLQEWGPILALPTKTRRGWAHPTRDEDGHIDFGAFGTIDFDRVRPEFDKARYKADKLAEEIKNELIMIEIIGRRLPAVRGKVLKLVKQGTIGLEDIQDLDMYQFTLRCLRVIRMRKQIAELREASWSRRRRKAAWLEE